MNRKNRIERLEPNLTKENGSHTNKDVLPNNGLYIHLQNKPVNQFKEGVNK